MIKFGNDIVTVGGDWLKYEAPDPSGLPERTIRVRWASDATPHDIEGATITRVAGYTDIYDIHIPSDKWNSLFIYSGPQNLLEVIGANTRGVTDMGDMFNACSSITTVPLFDTSKVVETDNMFTDCTSLRTVPLFDTSNVINMYAMFDECTSLTSIPLFNTSKAERVHNMFWHCYKVESGALALYQQMSSQANPPAVHGSAFFKCGQDTVTGAAELAQIPSSWGGTGA